jgi:hypothetical protein
MDEKFEDRDGVCVCVCVCVFTGVWTQGLTFAKQVLLSLEPFFVCWVILR